MANRRDFLQGTPGTLAAAGASTFVPRARGAALLEQPAELTPGATESAQLEALAGKLPLIKRSYRPPNFETPLEYFRDPITPHRAFFGRYHLANIPEVDAAR